jgi:uncharacterized SAM-binding protein YcdF (DUF218 family)
LAATGALTVAMTLLALTGVPWMLYGWLAVPGPDDADPPDFIVMMGGGGVPSESGFIRSWKAAAAAAKFSDAAVIIAAPIEPEETEHDDIWREIVMRGVPPERILREAQGRNTHEQALGVTAKVRNAENGRSPVVGIVTSPEHMRRTWLSFKRAGIDRLRGFPSWSTDIESDLRYGNENDRDSALADVVGQNLTLRYRFWDNLGLLVKCARELAGLCYYRVMGWA